MTERDDVGQSPLETTFEQQLEIWVYTHPSPTKPTSFAGNTYVPIDILREVQSRAELGQEFEQSLEQLAQGLNVPPSVFMQRAIEANLRPAETPPALPEVEDRQGTFEDALAVKRLYTRGLRSLEGVVGVGVGALNPEKPCITLYLRSATIANSLPTRLEGIPTRFEVTGIIVAAST